MTMMVFDGTKWVPWANASGGGVLDFSGVTDTSPRPLPDKWASAPVMRMRGDQAPAAFAGSRTPKVPPRIEFDEAPTSCSRMFQNCTMLTEAPMMDTSKTKRVDRMFENCSELKTVPALDFSAVEEDQTYNMFAGCSKLTSIKIVGLRVSFSVEGTGLQSAALNELFRNIGTPDPGTALYMSNTPGADYCNRRIAQSKGWWLL